MTWPCASSESTDSIFSWIYTNTNTLTCDFETPLKGFKSLFLVNLCSSNFYNTGSQVSSMNITSRRLERVLGTKPYSYKLEAQDALFSLSKSSENVVKVFLYILEVFHLKPKTFKQSLGWNRILQKFHVCDFRSVESNFRLVKFHWIWILFSATWMFLCSDL